MMCIGGFTHTEPSAPLRTPCLLTGRTKYLEVTPGEESTAWDDVSHYLIILS